MRKLNDLDVYPLPDGKIRIIKLDSNGYVIFDEVREKEVKEKVAEDNLYGGC